MCDDAPGVCCADDTRPQVERTSAAYAAAYPAGPAVGALEHAGATWETAADD
ncbi:hypothetical protein GALL_233310 [mine drainage metagenome]|uniref:Uncharacterized protein n=1 Tax=mine drainage metagenome TaxID=410659 RepID=A0A1J5RFW8_9ZZZZ